jgi:MarR family transcriptional regulator, organic hydroperoxide resistance regulator
VFINYTRAMVQPNGDACRAWQLLVRFFFAQREHLPTLEGEFELSPIQCHVLHLLEPGRPLPMGRLAGMLGCHASNVTGLVDRLEARGVVLRQPSPDDRRVKVLDLTPEGARLRAQVLRRMTTGARPLSRLTLRQQRTLVKILEVLVDESSTRATT